MQAGPLISGDWEKDVEEVELEDELDDGEAPVSLVCEKTTNRTRDIIGNFGGSVIRGRESGTGKSSPMPPPSNN